MEHLQVGEERRRVVMHDPNIHLPSPGPLLVTVTDECIQRGNEVARKGAEHARRHDRVVRLKERAAQVGRKAAAVAMVAGVTVVVELVTQPPSTAPPVASLSVERLLGGATDDCSLQKGVKLSGLSLVAKEPPAAPADEYYYDATQQGSPQILHIEAMGDILNQAGPAPDANETYFASGDLLRDCTFSAVTLFTETK